MSRANLIEFRICKCCGLAVVANSATLAATTNPPPHLLNSPSAPQPYLFHHHRSCPRLSLSHRASLSPRYILSSKRSPSSHWIGSSPRSVLQPPTSNLRSQVPSHSRLPHSLPIRFLKRIYSVIQVQSDPCRNRLVRDWRKKGNKICHRRYHIYPSTLSVPASTFPITIRWRNN